MAEKLHLNIDELYETKKKNDLNRLELYNKLLLKIHNKIKNNVLLKFNKLLIHLHFVGFVYHTFNITRKFPKSTDGFNNPHSLRIAHTTF